jgi:hypothetical protein
MKKKLLIILLTATIVTTTYSQDFGFGFDEEAEDPRPPVSFKAGGELALALAPYVHDLGEAADYSELSLSGFKLNLSLLSPYIDVFANLNINRHSVGELWFASDSLKKHNYTPLIIDETFFRAYIKSVDIEAGYRKLSWGKADSPGPLDVINPIDYSDLRTITDIKANKIARPMMHVTWNTGNFSKLEGVFIPNLEVHRFAQQGRWLPSQLDGIMTRIEPEITARASSRVNSQVASMIAANPSLALILLDPRYTVLFNTISETAESYIASYFNDYPVEFPDTAGIKYFQAGLRYTTTIRSFDIGGQYYYGSAFRPHITFKQENIDAYVNDLIDKNIAALPGIDITNIDPSDFYQGDPSLLNPEINYSRYHQIGLDYAQVLFGFNLRAELAIHLTEDIKGDKGSVQNPFLGWSLGFDRDLFWGINLNLQCNETIRLLNSRVGDNPVYDIEAGTNVTATRLTSQLSKKFLRDNLETKVTVIWGIEDSDCYILPAVIYTSGDITSELSAGIFAGKETGELGQYWANSFIKLGIKYTF